MYKKNQNSEENFWISYADLMAGLLFVFILVIGAIVIKYAITQNILEEEKKALNSSEEQKSKLFLELAKANNLYESTKKDLQNSKNEINLKASEIEKLKALLLDVEVKYKDEQTKNQNLAGELNEKTNVITLRDEEIKLLADKLLVQTQIHQKMVEEFDIAKLKIKTLTGLKLNVIAKLKDRNESGLLPIDIAKQQVEPIIRNQKKAEIIKKKMNIYLE